MKILVDADACPVKELIVRCAGKHHVPVVMVADAAHVFSHTEPFVSVVTVDKGADSADLALANRTQAGDITVTADYGLASLLLAKKAFVLHPNGFAFTLENIDRMLFERHLSAEMRRQKRSRGSHIKKRTKEEDEKFLSLLEKTLEQAEKKNP